MIRILISVLFLTFCLSCATTSEPFVTKHGLVVDANGFDVTQAQVEMATDLLMESFVVKRVYTRTQVDRAFKCIGYLALVKAGSVLCPTKKKPERTCQGLHNHQKRKIWYVHHKDLYDTSLVHELIHMVKWKLEKDPDPMHLDIFSWEKACRRAFPEDEMKQINCEMNSVEGFTNSMLRGLTDG